MAWRQSSLKWTDIKSSNSSFIQGALQWQFDTQNGRKTARGGYITMSSGEVFDYQVLEIFGEAIASPEAVGNTTSQLKFLGGHI
jgi:hypothetical protein